jgi:signal transduction histidine kinase
LGAGLQTDIAQVLNGLVEGVGAEMGACYFFDSKTGVLTPQKAVGTVALGFLKATGLALVENDPLASVVINGNTILENSVGDQSKRGLQHRILPRNYVANSLLIVPMKIDSEVLGLFLLASQESNKFSQNDLSLALATATGTAAAMISARLLDTSQQQVRQAAIVKDLALAINSSLEVNQIAKLFLIKARALVSYDLAALILFDGDVYKVQVLVNDDGELVVKEETEGRLSGSLYEKIKNGKILARRALGENDEYSTQKPLEIRLGNQFSEVLIPLKVKDQIAGCIAFRSPQSMAYPEKNNEDLYELASLGGMAISNAVLYSSTLSQTHHLDLLLNSLSEVSSLLTSTTEGPKALEKKAVETVSRLFGSRIAVLTKMENGEHKVIASQGASPYLGTRDDALVVATGAGLIGAVTLKQEVVRLVAMNNEQLIEPLVDAIVPVTSGLGVPMFLSGIFQGVLAVFGTQPYDDGDVAVMTTVSNQVGVAIRNAELFAKSERALWELSNLHQGLQAITSSLEMQNVLATILKNAVEAAHAQIGSIMLLENGRLELKGTVGTDGRTAQKLSLGIGEGIAGKVVATGIPILANDVNRHPDFTQPPVGMLVPKALMCVPLKSGNKVIGVINLSNYIETNVFDEEGMRVVTSLANQTSIAVENARLFEDLREERDRLISLEEVLRQDLARDLHDGPVQRLVGMSMNIEFIKTILNKDPVRALAEISELEKLVHISIKESRTMLFELRPLVLETQGLAAAIRSYAEQFEANNGIVVELNLAISEQRFPSAIEQTFFSVIQEALGNIKKHSKATKVEIELTASDKLITGIVVDNGVGFDQQEVEANYSTRESQSLGLLNMVERGERIGGDVELESVIGRGTKLTITAPIGIQEVRKKEVRGGA